MLLRASSESKYDARLRAWRVLVQQRDVLDCWHKNCLLRRSSSVLIGCILLSALNLFSSCERLQYPTIVFGVAKENGLACFDNGQILQRPNINLIVLTVL